MNGGTQRRFVDVLYMDMNAYVLCVHDSQTHTPCHVTGSCDQSSITDGLKRETARISQRRRVGIDDVVWNRRGVHRKVGEAPPLVRGKRIVR